MSDFFQLPIGTAGLTSTNHFEAFGLQGNPFPPTGVDSGVLFTDHLTRELLEVQVWIDEVGRVTNCLPEDLAAVRPLAIFGSLGVGKTHLLNYLEQGLKQNPMTPTLRKGLADEGMSRLVLADLFLRYLPFSDEGGEPGAGMIARLLATARDDAALRERMLGSLRDGSPVRVPFFAAVDSKEKDAGLWLSRWVRREYTTPSQRSKLGLAGVLQSEGEAVRAMTDLMRLAHAAGLVRAWFILIDQLEELWRPNVITPTRRARFLTDLRHMVDQSLEGAPIALLLAWNTTVERGARSAPPAVRERMEHDYRALWQRLGRPLDLPFLSPRHVWPFAKQYLEAAGVSEDAPDEKRALFFERMRQLGPMVARQQADAGPGGLAPRKVLAAWREVASDVAQRGAS